MYQDCEVLCMMALEALVIYWCQDLFGCQSCVLVKVTQYCQMNRG